MFHGSRYAGYGEMIRQFKPGRVMGPGTLPECGGDGMAGGGGEEVPVRALPGVDPAQAVLAVGGVWIADGAGLPEAVVDARQPVDCRWSGDRQVTGRWTAVSPRQSSSPGLHPPYWIGAVFDGASLGLPRWGDVSVHIQIDDSTYPTLNQRDVQQALWHRGTLTVELHCSHGDFVAVSVTTEPPR